MSADNGYIIRQRDDGKFTLQMYFASADDYPPIERAKEDEIFDTLEAAVLKYAKMERDMGFVSEYGLSVQTPLRQALDALVPIIDEIDSGTVFVGEGDLKPNPSNT